MSTDLDIARKARMLPIEEIAKKLEIPLEYVECYGRFKAKLGLELLKIDGHSKEKKRGKLILVTAISPTPAGEGKTTTSIGLAQGLSQLGEKAIVALREPSLGPVLGLKGGATGGGYAQVLPSEDINLHFTGDFHAITTANNAVSALLDNHLHHGNSLRIDPKRILWKRVLDMNDRCLRSVIVGMGGTGNGVMREEGFNITPASEIMAILCLSSSVEDMKKRLGQILLAYNNEGQPVYLRELKIEGAIAHLLKDALLPNLVQTIENTPAVIHGGPFANIAHGCSSILATEMALTWGDYCVTEAGFGADLGAEKFLDIKVRIAQEAGIDVVPSVVVIVATVRALKMHGGLNKTQLSSPDVEALKRGVENLAKHIETVQHFGLPYCVAINRFDQDATEELEALKSWCDREGHPVVFSEGWARGGRGCVELATKVLEIAKRSESHSFTPLYDVNAPIIEKIEAIVKKAYGGDGVDFSPTALSQIRLCNKNGWDRLPICVAKTPASLSDDPTKIGRPLHFRILIREIRPNLGAGFLVALSGDVMTMPGLPKEPAALGMGRA